MSRLKCADHTILITWDALGVYSYKVRCRYERAGKRDRERMASADHGRTHRPGGISGNPRGQHGTTRDRSLSASSKDGSIGAGDRGASPAWDGSENGSENVGELVGHGEARQEHRHGLIQDEECAFKKLSLHKQQLNQLPCRLMYRVTKIW
jgi:hypothetical protein